MHAYWTSMLWSIDSCQNIVSAALHHLTVLRARVSTHRGQVFRPSYPLTSYYFSNDRRLKFNFFIIHLTYAVFMCRTIKSLISNWPRTRNSASYLRQRRQLLLTLLTIVMCWSRSTSNFYALIGQNWTGEFMPKIYAASWKLFTLTAEAERVLCQLLMFLTALSTGCTKWNSAVIHG